MENAGAIFREENREEKTGGGDERKKERESSFGSDATHVRATSSVFRLFLASVGVDCQRNNGERWDKRGDDVPGRPTDIFPRDKRRYKRP